MAIIGIIVAIAIPNLLNAIQRAKQKRSMGDMRSAGTAAEAYSIDYNAYPPAAADVIPSGMTYGGTTLGANMSKYVQPTYIQVIPFTDGWSSWFLYNVGNNNQDFIIVCGGKDGALSASVPVGGPFTNFNTDIIFADGQFTSFPDGVQQ